MYFKVYKKFDQINAGLMTISDFLGKIWNSNVSKLLTYNLYLLHFYIAPI